MERENDACEGDHGLLPHVSGEVRFGEHVINGMRSHEIARLGIGLVPQGRWIFPKLTVRENLMMGTAAAGDAEILEEVFEYFPVLKTRLSQHGGTLSGGEQQVLAIARALCGRPKLLLLDEPSDGVQPNLVELIGDVIPVLCRRSKLAVLLVEQNLDLVLRCAQRCIVLKNGQLAHAGKSNRNAARTARTRWPNSCHLLPNERLIRKQHSLKENLHETTRLFTICSLGRAWGVERRRLSEPCPSGGADQDRIACAVEWPTYPGWRDQSTLCDARH